MKKPFPETTKGSFTGTHIPQRLDERNVSTMMQTDRRQACCVVSAAPNIAGQTVLVSNVSLANSGLRLVEVSGPHMTHDMSSSLEPHVRSQ